MSWLSYKYKSKHKRPTPHWVKWGVVAFFVIAGALASRNPKQFEDSRPWPTIDIGGYMNLVKPPPGEEPAAESETQNDKEAKPTSAPRDRPKANSEAAAGKAAERHKPVRKPPSPAPEPEPPEQDRPAEDRP